MGFVSSFSSLSSSSRSTIVTQTRLQLEMKGKEKRVPIDQRGEFVKRQRILEAQAEIDKKKPTGVPIFKVYIYIQFYLILLQ